jgi:hypothetical protein
MMIIKQAFEDGITKEELFEITAIDPWWLAQLEELHQIEGWVWICLGRRGKTPTKNRRKEGGRHPSLPAPRPKARARACKPRVPPPAGSRPSPPRTTPAVPRHPPPRPTPPRWLKTKRLSELSVEDLRNLKSRGFSDAEIGRLVGGWRGGGGAAAGGRFLDSTVS